MLRLVSVQLEEWIWSNVLLSLYTRNIAQNRTGLTVTIPDLALNPFTASGQHKQSPIEHNNHRTETNEPTSAHTLTLPSYHFCSITITGL